MYDYLIVGQGTAGTMLAHCLSKRQKNFLVIDNGNLSAASTVAAGIVNPITGKRYVKSWRIDEFLPYAKDTYHEISRLLNVELVVERNIVRLLLDSGQENDWYSRSSEEGYGQYLIQEPVNNFVNILLKEGASYAEIANSFQVKLFELIPRYRDLLVENNQYLKEQFDFDQLVHHADYISYKNIKAKKIIFAEGHKVTTNPYFDRLPFEPVKGEVLLVRIPNLNMTKILKHRLFIVPMYEDIYWVGSNYEWEYTDENPSEKIRLELKETLDQILLIPYEIVDHKCGIRPSFKPRRPIMIHHPRFKNIVLFNGFGTKGTSLIPYWANHLVNHLEDGDKLDNMVSSNRYIEMLKVRK